MDKELQELVNKFMPKTNYGHEARHYAKIIAKQYADQQINKLKRPISVNPLPEYDEILCQVKRLTDEQFREYWNEIKSNVL